MRGGNIGDSFKEEASRVINKVREITDNKLDAYLGKKAQGDENNATGGSGAYTSNQMGSTKRFRCKNGYNQRPPKSKKCKTIRRKKCKNGWRRNPQTKRCRKRTTSNVATENLLETISPSYQNLTMNERLRV